MALSGCQSQQQRAYDSFKPAGYEQSGADSPKTPPEPGESITKGEKGDTGSETGQDKAEQDAHMDEFHEAEVKGREAQSSCRLLRQLTCDSLKPAGSPKSSVRGKVE
eukprot:14534620-Alexandrium_andersonii.AAC.1